MTGDVRSQPATASLRWFPRTAYAWRRIKLLWAELLVVSVCKGDHSLGYLERMKDAADAIKEFREMYYPKPPPGGNVMPYDYIKQTYGVSPEPGKIVYHTVTKEWGVITREDRSASHYAQVKFEGARHASPCHPTDLQYDVGRP